MLSNQAPAEPLHKPLVQHLVRHRVGVNRLQESRYSGASAAATPSLESTHLSCSTGDLPPEDQMQKLLASLPPETRNVVESALKGQVTGASKVRIITMTL